MRRPRLTDELLDELGDELAAEGGALELAGELALLAGDAEGSAALRERLLATLRTAHRFDDLEARVAELTDLDLEQVRALLLAVDGPEAERGGRWEAGPSEHVRLLHFAGGPAVEGAITGFVRIAPGEAFPEHEHVGDEAVLILQGALRDETDGSLHGRGEVVRKGPGTSHVIRAHGEVPLVYLVVVREGVRIGGELITPDDPRA